uniref:MI domain-containing protein n=1 Tax=Arion vulgaris TaxID=1028688 RepID=A0A0B7B9X8_9EUPU
MSRKGLKGGSAQVKDGRKGKKGKKDFICKEIGGTDMDAFIDVDGANSGAGESNITKTNNALDVTTEAGSNGIAPQSSIGHSSTKNIETSVVSKDSESSNVNVPKVSQTPEVSGAHFDTGYSRDDSPIPQKSYQEQQRPAIASAQAQSEVVEVDEKPPLPQTTAVRKSSLDKSSIQEFKIPSTSIPATQETFKATKEPLSQPLVPPTITKPTHHIEIKMDKTVAAPQKEIKATVEAVPTTDTAVSITTTNITKHDNQQQIEQKGTSVRSNPRLSGQAERQISKPLENGIKDNLHSEPFSTATSNITSDSSETNLQVIGHDNQLPREPVSELEDLKVGQSHGTDNEESPTKLSSEKALNRVKRDKDKLQYDRAYLMELRQCASSQTKPEGLPNLEIILDRPVISAGRGSSTAPVDFTPAFFQPIGNQRHAPQIGKTNSRNRPRSDIQMPQRVIKSVSLQDSVKPLHQSEKPWKPSQKQVSSTGELSEKRRSLESEVLFIMNRLTPTNFERLAGEMKTLNIKSYEDLQELVKIFFDKVTMETKFVEAYANLCKVMSGLRVQPPPNTAIKDNQATFRVVMLTKCQQEFEADKTVVFEDPEEKKKKIESEMPEGPERTAQIENTLYQMKLKRLKFYGNIRFIGELFKLGMLTENIMHDCIYRLLKARDDDSLVSLCNLVATVGQVLDTDKAKTRMDQYYAQMAKIAEERKSRIKFTLKDAIDLRSNNWVPRKEQAGPKKIDEVHKDYQDEQATKQFLQSQPLPPRNDTPQPNSRRGSRQRQDDNKLTDEGWNTVGSKSLRIDASKMKLSKNVVDENIQLGPGGGMKQYSMWSKGSYGGSQLSQDNDRATPTNRFSALHGEEERLTYQRSPSRGDNSAANRGLRQGPTAGHGRGKILARSSQEGDRRDALASARSIVGGRSQNSSRDNSWNREDRRQIIGPRGSRESENPMTRSEILLRPSTDSLHVPTTVSPVPGVSAPTGLKVKQLSVDEMEKKAKTILEEYLSVMDLEEAKLCLHELSNQEHLHVFVTACINEVLERSLKARELTGSFFHEMIRQSNLAKDIYLKGLADVLQYAEDMVIDIPMIFTYLAQMIVPMLIGGSVAWSLLPTALKPLLGERSSGVLVAEILLLAKEKTSEDDVALMWQNNNLNWTTFLPAEEVDRFLKDKKLEFTVSQVTRVASRVPVYSPIDLQKVSEDIENIVLKNGTSIDVWSYIEARVPVDRQDKPFIRALVTALINASISTPAMKFSEEVIKSRKDVLRRCIKSNPELELQALYAVQAVMHKLEHPSGVVATIFDMLYDEDIVSEDTFKQWQKSTDPQEMEGKGTCSMQLTHFFTWLRENEEPETS